MSQNTQGTKEEQRYRVEAVTRAVRLLREMRENGAQATAALAEATDTPPAFAAQALETLARHGLVRPLGTDWGLGRALLSRTSPDELGEYFAQATTSAARGAKLLDITHYAQELEEVRERGFATVNGEMTRDTVAVSAPVRDHTGAVVAALTISAPSDRVTPESQEACTKAVIRAGQELSQLLGFGATQLPQDQE